MKKEDYDFLSGLSTDSIEELSEIIEKYPISDKASIINSCEEKLAMKNNNNNLYEVNEPVEVIKKMPWYRNSAFTIAASLALVVGVAGAGFIGFGNGRKPESQPPVSTQISDENSTESATTTTVIEAPTTEAVMGSYVSGSYVSPSSLTTADITTTEAPMSTVRIDDVQSCVALASLSTTEYVEVVTPVEPVASGVVSGSYIPQSTTTVVSSLNPQSTATTDICSGVPLSTTVNWESVAQSVLSTATTDESGIPPQIHLPDMSVEVPVVTSALSNETAPAQSGLISGRYTQQPTSATEPIKSSCTVTTPID